MKKTPNKYTKLRSAIRQFWYRYWPHRTDALLLARVPYVGESKQRKYAYVCAICKIAHVVDDVQVDHIEPCGQFLGPDDESDFVFKLLFGQLQVLCKSCHKIKTAKDRKRIKNET